MEIDVELIKVLAGFATGIVGAIGGLILFMWRSVNARLRTLGHEDRDIRSTVNGVMTLLIDHLTVSESDLMKENERLKWMLSSMGNKRENIERSNQEIK